MSANNITETDLSYLRRCVELAAEALAEGDEPFGSLLLSAAGEVLFEDRNRVKDGDHTRHPELAIALWAVANLSPQERAAATVYTSGEHCPMCSAAHAWVGLGRIVFASSTGQLSRWCASWGLPEAPVAALPITTVAPGIQADGPVEEFAEELRAMQATARGVVLG